MLAIPVIENTTVHSLAKPNCVYRIFRYPKQKAQLIQRFRSLGDAEGWANFLNIHTQFYHAVIFNPFED